LSESFDTPKEFIDGENARPARRISPLKKFTKEFLQKRPKPSKELQKKETSSESYISETRTDDYGEDSDTRLRKFTAMAEPDRTYTLSEIADAMGVTRERVRQIEEQALRTFGRRFKQILKSDGLDMEEFKR
jgi:DNA-directed RNA polymerase sigma subunit (sigma70/sigma32)